MSGVTKKLMSTSGGVAGGEMIEDVFSTYLYTGNSSTQTITNDIDLAGEGGLVWIKSRNYNYNNNLFDSERGTTSGRHVIESNSTSAQGTGTFNVTTFNSDGFSLGAGNQVNNSLYNYASWTFRKAPRFFDVVTYTGDGNPNRAIAHNLGTIVGSIFIKRTDDTRNWAVYHRSTTDFDYSLRLNTTDAQLQDNYFSAAPDDSSFYIDKSPGGDLNVNASGGTYVAYLFAHDPLGPSGDGSDGLIDCGSYTGNDLVDGPEISLGWEPQWLLIKSSTGGFNWVVVDNMRGIPSGGTTPYLNPNNSSEENTASGDLVDLTPTGFKLKSGNAQTNNPETYIYIAIRRGPMRAPESGTEVFAMDNGGGGGFASGFPVDSAWTKNKDSANNWKWYDRLRGHGSYLNSNLPNAETGASTGTSFASNTEFDYGLGADNIGYIFRRAPEFFDAVAYTGDGVQGHNVSHNLGVAPDMMIVKQRSTTFIDGEWQVYVSGITHLSVYGSDPDNYGDNPVALRLDSTGDANFSRSGTWDHTHPTDTFFRLGDTYHTNRNGDPYIAYLFATLAGVSKVGSYTGNGTNQTINCGFTTGARFILIKRTDAVGDWYVWDTARGIIAGNDPHLSLNTTAAEVTTDDSIDPDSSGFIVNQVAATNINVSSASYIFYAIA